MVARGNTFRQNGLSFARRIRGDRIPLTLFHERIYSDDDSRPEDG